MNASNHSTANGDSAVFHTSFDPVNGAGDMGGVLLPSVKLRPPKLPPEMLARSELLARVRQWRTHRLSVIVAPAGYGKTLLATSALPATPSTAEQQPDSPTGLFAWLTLDEDDDTPARFVQSLAASLTPLIPHTAHASTLLALTIEEARRAMLLLLAALEKLADSVLLVLDDYHRLHNPAVHDLLGGALEYTPENVHWLILTRQALPVSLGRLRLQRQVLELNANDLRLNRAEIQSFLQLNHIHVADSEVLDLMEAHTQGWFAGLQLALLSILSDSDSAQGYRREGSEAHDFYTLFGRLSSDKSLLAQYLADEVLKHLDRPLRSFLLRCAILERLHPPLCIAVTGMEESEQFLRQAVAQQLFLRPLDDIGAWYELHSLFREVLLQHLRIEEGEAAVKALYRRAADWYVNHGELVAGLRALLAGGFSYVAAELVQSRAQTALLDNHLTELQQWFDLLPSEEIDARPRLLLDLTWLSFLRSFGFAAAFARTSSRLATLPTLPKPWQDEFSALTLLSRFYDGPRQNLHHDALKAIQGFDASSHLARGWALFTASLLINQEPGRQLSEYTLAIDAAFDAAGFVRGRIYTLARQIHQDLLTAQVESVLRNNTRVLELMARQHRPEPGDAMYVNFTAGEALYWQNRLPEAIVYLRRVWHETLTYQDPVLLLQAQAVIKLYNHATGEAEVVLDSVAEAHHWKQAQELGLMANLATIVLWELRYGIACGAPQTGLRRFGTLGLTLDSIPTDAPDLIWLGLLTAYVAKGEQLERLTPKFELMLERAHAISSPYFTIQINLLQARQLHQLGRRNTARGVMRQLLRDVEATGYVRMILDQPELIPILQLAGSNYARWLLTLPVKPARPASATAFSPREERLLALLADGLTTAQIAEHLVLTASTTRSYLSRLYAKMGVNNHAQATAWARRHLQQ